MLLRFDHAYYYNLVFRLRPLLLRLVSCAVETETRVLRSLLIKLFGNDFHCCAMIYYKTYIKHQYFTMIIYFYL